MQFHYIASQRDGRVVEGDVEAGGQPEVLKLLLRKGLKPVSIQPLARAGARDFGLLGGRVTITDQIFISKYLSLMLKIGTGLMEAINILIADFGKPAVKKILIEIRSALEQGKPLSSTFARYPKVFSHVYTNMVRAGEVSGNLQTTFEDLTEMLSKEKDLRDRIRSALIYPMLLLIGSFLILTFITMFALPKIATIFLEGGFEPPTFSRIVFTIGLFAQRYGFYILGAIVVGIVAAVRAYRSSIVFQRFVANVIGDIPGLRDLVKRIAVQRFASILASLLRAGLPITEALDISAQAAGNVELRLALTRISREGVAKGLTIGEAFRRESYFPMTVVNLIVISEKAGHLAEVLVTLSEFYAKEIDSAVKMLVSFLEPVLLVLIGAVIGIIALSIVVPIYQLTAQFA